MFQIEWTSIILGILTLLGGCGWFVEGRKHRETTRLLNADHKLKEMELGQLYVEQFEQNIAEPLRRDVRELKDKVKNLKDELENVKKTVCYRTECPYRIGAF
jgi:hypothetical protein